MDARFRSLYEGEFRNVYRAVWLLVRDRGLAEDATQEAFARALRRWDRLQGQTWLPGWITTTAMNHARRASLWRRSQGRLQDVESPIAGGPDVEASLDLWTAVRALPRRQQEAVVLHYLLDMPIADVSHVMGCRDGTVKAHLFKAREALAALVEEEDQHHGGSKA